MERYDYFFALVKSLTNAIESGCPVASSTHNHCPLQFNSRNIYSLPQFLMISMAPKLSPYAAIMERHCLAIASGNSYGVTSTRPYATAFLQSVSAVGSTCESIFAANNSSPMTVTRISYTF